jgi:hypothetical protein
MILTLHYQREEGSQEGGAVSQHVGRAGAAGHRPQRPVRQASRRPRVSNGGSPGTPHHSFVSRDGGLTNIGTEHHTKTTHCHVSWKIRKVKHSICSLWSSTKY